jgi:diguanylate cyclase (GGDEF)-like protein
MPVDRQTADPEPVVASSADLPGAAGGGSARSASQPPNRAVAWTLAGAALVLLLLLLQLLFDFGDTVDALLWRVELLVQVPAVLALYVRSTLAADVGERRFWRLVCAAIAMWLASTVSGLVLEDGLVQQLLSATLLLLDFGFLIVALHSHPHVAYDPYAYPLRVMEWIGSTLLLLALLIYFVVVPMSRVSVTLAAGYVSPALWVTLDVYVLAWLVLLRQGAGQASWRFAYGWLLFGMAANALGDFSYLLGFGDRFDVAGTPSGMERGVEKGIYVLGLCGFAVAASARPRESSDAGQRSMLRVPGGMGPLVLYTSVPVILHLVLYRAGAFDADLELMHERVALAATALLMVLAFAYQRAQRRENELLAQEEREARHDLAHRAYHDQLTELPNRARFSENLEAAISSSARSGSRCAVLFCDLDQFKVLNDSLGHEAGDEALIVTAARLREAVRAHDTIARLGGDEFAVLAIDVRSAVDAAALGEKLLRVIGEPMMVSGVRHVLTASIGAAVYPDDGESVDALLKHADTAMYRSKQDGRNAVHLFTADMNIAAQRRHAIEQQLRAGLADGGFVVQYQTIVEIETGRIAGVEALLRWRREGELVSPVDFIDIAEQTGLILPIGHWVLLTACRWAVAQGEGVLAAASISVNVSPRQLRDEDLVAQVAEVLDLTGLAPRRLQLEITESAALTDEASYEVMEALQGLGVRIAIDDFGTGYSALSRLRELPADTLKIDQSFVRGVDVDPASEAIVRSIVTMAAALDLKVVAEGVETEAEMRVVRDARCALAQGFFFSRPMLGEDVARLPPALVAPD